MCVCVCVCACVRVHIHVCACIVYVVIEQNEMYIRFNSKKVIIKLAKSILTFCVPSTWLSINTVTLAFPLRVLFITTATWCQVCS